MSHRDLPPGDEQSPSRADVSVEVSPDHPRSAHKDGTEAFEDLVGSVVFSRPKLAQDWHNVHTVEPIKVAPVSLFL